MVILTQERIDKLKSPRGGVRYIQLQVIGECKKKGWFKRILGLEITKEQWDKMLSLGDKRTKEDIAEARRERRRKRHEKRYGGKKGKKKGSKKDRISAHKKKYYDYLASAEWAEIRNDLFTNRGRKCEYCGSTHRLQIHHLTYVNVFKEEPEDLVILCAACHKAEH